MILHPKILKDSGIAAIFLGGIWRNFFSAIVEFFLKMSLKDSGMIARSAVGEKEKRSFGQLEQVDWGWYQGEEEKGGG